MLCKIFYKKNYCLYLLCRGRFRGGTSRDEDSTLQSPEPMLCGQHRRVVHYKALNQCCANEAGRAVLYKALDQCCMEYSEEQAESPHLLHPTEVIESVHLHHQETPVLVFLSLEIQSHKIQAPEPAQK